jgi:hypothetical protein
MSARYPDDRFVFDRDHSLSQGCVLSGLGGNGCYESPFWFDNFGMQFGIPNNGTLTNMSIPGTPTSGWWWDAELMRPKIGYIGASSTVITFPAITIPMYSEFSFAAWIKKTNTDDLASVLGSNNGNSSAIRVMADGTVAARIDNSYALTAASAVGVGNITHLAVTRSLGVGGLLRCYVNGNNVTSGTPGDAYDITWTYLGSCASSGRFWTGDIYDAVLATRVWSQSEISILASRDPSYGGWLRPARRWLPVAAAGAAFKPYWATRRQRTIGSGVI